MGIYKPLEDVLFQNKDVIQERERYWFQENWIQQSPAGHAVAVRSDLSIWKQGAGEFWRKAACTKMENVEFPGKEDVLLRKQWNRWNTQKVKMCMRKFANKIRQLLMQEK